MRYVSEITVNGVPLAVDAPADQPLLHVLREELGLTGCKIGCGEGACGACTVVVDDQVVRSCITPVGEIGLGRINTIEGLERDGKLHPLQQAFMDEDAMQCGYCTSGMIMAALALLRAVPRPSDAQIVDAMQGNICRCGTYGRILRAIRRASDTMVEGASV